LKGEKGMNKLNKAISGKKFQLIADRPLSNHPEDRHLRVVLVQLNDSFLETFAVYLFNADDGGFYEGKYFDRLSDAW